MASRGDAKRAANRVLAAVKAGELVRGERCELCGTACKAVAHHHRGYDFPLNVWWICRACNKRLEHEHTGQLSKEQAIELVRVMAGEEYAQHRAEMGEKSRENSEHGRNIDPLPDVVNRRRRNRCRKDFRRFCETYFPERFNLAWGRDQLEVLGTLQQVVIGGGQFALAMPRGSGKTTLTTTAAIFAILYGHRRFVAFVASTGTVAQDRLAELIRAPFETNELLFEDFPEVCYPVRRLENNSARARMQKLDGEFTRIIWGAEQIKMPVVKGSPSSGARVVCAGLESGDIRGLLKAHPEGGLDRPDLVICDDPQTDGSARSPMQCNTREGLLTGAVLGLAGPGKKISVVVPCTIIRPGDLSDRILDRKRNPEWQGKTFRLVDSMPKRMDLWVQYADLLRDGFAADPKDLGPSTEFYRERRAEMDAGSDLPWPARSDPDCISALQYAMNLYILKPAVFAAEYQNRPIADEAGGGAEPIDPGEVREKLNRSDRGVVPADCTRLTAFIDPKQEIFCWCVVGFNERFSPAVIDYGTFPRQHAAHFSATDPNPTLSHVYKENNWPLEARLYAGLTALAKEILDRPWARADGTEPMRVERCLVDTGAGQWADVVHQWVRQSPSNAVIRASRGRYVGAKSAPFNKWKHAPAVQEGVGWRLEAKGGKHGREYQFDSNFWKSFVAERCRTAMGSPGCLTLFGGNPAAHALFCDHLAAEFPVRMRAEGTSRVVDEWQSRPGRPDNDYLDCLVGCCVAVSTLGLKWDAAVAAGEPPAPAPERKPMKKFSEIQREKLTAAGRR